MPARPRRKPAYDVERIERDMTAQGWLPIDLARAAQKSHTAVGKFLKRVHQTPRMAKAISGALGHEPDYYLVAEEAQAVAS